MTDDAEAVAPPTALPEASVARQTRFSFIWLIPLVALGLAGYLAFVTLSQEGPTISITFKSAQGLEPGKTKVKLKEVAVGTVRTVVLSGDLSHVVVTAEMDRTVEDYLREGSQFWVAQPRLSAGGVSGLDTLVSGARIDMIPGTGEPTDSFVGLDSPPVVPAGVPGTEFQLSAARKGSIGPGSVILFRGIEVGQIQSFELEGDGEAVLFRAFIRAPYDRLVRNNTRFWNASGIDIGVAGTGVEIEMTSLAALLTGAVTFDSPLSAMASDTSPAGTRFPLYPNRTAANEANLSVKVPYVLYFDGSVRGLKVGSSVEFRGIRVGTVTDVRMVIDAQTKIVRIPVIINIEPDRIEVAGAAAGEEEYAVMRDLVARGLRAQLNVASLITGDLYVLLDFFPNEPPADLQVAGTIPEIPTVASEFEQFVASVNGVLQKVSKLPLEGLIADTRTAVQNLDALIASSDVRATVVSLRDAARSADTTLKQAERTLISLDGLVSPDSKLRYDLGQAVEALRATLRTVRALAGDLEQRPESLIRGKPAGSR